MASPITKVILGMIFVLNILSFFSASVLSGFFFSLYAWSSLLNSFKKVFYTIHVSFNIEYFLSVIHWSIKVQAGFSTYTFERCIKPVIISKEVTHHTQMVYIWEFWWSFKYDLAEFLTKPAACLKMG